VPKSVPKYYFSINGRPWTTAAAAAATTSAQNFLS